MGLAMLDILPFTKFTKEPLPPRVRSLLEGAYQAGWHTLEPVLKRVVTDYEQVLFKEADKAGSTQEQSECFAAMRQLRKHAVDLEVSMRDELQRGIVAMVTRDGERVRANSDQSHSATLGLVETSDLEESLALGEYSAKAEMRYSSSLHHLSYRFAAIAGCPPIDHEVLPLGPNAMADGLRAAGHSMELGIAYRVRFYNFAERHLLPSYGALLDAVNGFLAEAKVLPNFHEMAQRSRPPAAAPSASEEKPAREKPADELEQADEAVDPQGDFGSGPQAGAQSASAGQHSPGPAGQYQQPGQPGNYPQHGHSTGQPGPEGQAGHPGQPTNSGQAPAVSPSESSPFIGSAPGRLGIRQADAARPAFSALNELWNDARQHAAPGPRSDVGSVQAPEDQAELFTTLRELLAGKRTQLGQPQSRGAAGGQQAAPADLQAVLSVLQTQNAAPVMVDGKWKARKVSDVKQDLLNQLRALGDGTPPVLSEEDNDTVDLVGMLFDQLSSGLSPVSVSHSLMTKLQVPLLKVALNDKGFFTRRKHPARLLLNEVAEAAALWVEDEQADKPVLDKMQLVVDRVTRDYDQDHEIFEQQLGDLGGHLQAVRRKADIAEKRQVDAARGREKMELSRAAALEALQARVDAAEPHESISSFLLEAWADVLALSLLRQGPHGEDFEQDLDLADQLLALTDSDVPVADRRKRFDSLVVKLADGVAGVGMHADAFKKAKVALYDALGLNADTSALPEQSAEAINEALKSRPRLGADQGGASVGTILDGLRRGERVVLSPDEKAMVDRIKQLPFGTWFDFVKNQQGERVSRKLSWFSPVTGRCLFVNPRGAKAEDRTIDELARELVRGTARVVVEQKERLIDRAWKAIIGAFKGGRKVPEVAGAQS